MVGERECIYIIYKQNLPTNMSNVAVISLIQIEELNECYWIRVQKKKNDASMGIKRPILRKFVLFENTLSGRFA